MALVLRIFLLIGSFTGILCASHLLNQFADANRGFSAAVYQELAKVEPGNFMVCPISVQMVMALAGLGAKGETFNQISTGLKLPNDPALTENIFENLTPQLRGNQFYSLSAANKIYTMEGFRINKTYQALAKNIFDAEVEPVDFVQNVAASRAINSWVEQKTNNKIHDLIKPQDLNPSTRLLLINAMHFKGRWKKPFEVYDTFKKPFYISETENRMVDMMHITDVFNYFEDKNLDCKFLEMPYEGGDVNMMFILPNQRTGLRNLEYYTNVIFQQQPPFVKQHVRVAIPKFTMETTIQFVPILQKLGVHKPFALEADFSGISANGVRLSIDKVIQKTFINVTERGTEAAAATAGGVVTLSIPAPDRLAQLEFKADHPFITLLQFTNRSRRAPAILFAGRYTGSSESSFAPLVFDTNMALLDRIGYISEPFNANHPFIFILIKDQTVIFTGRYVQPSQDY